MKVISGPARRTASKYPSYCCQRCGEEIGWLGRACEMVYSLVGVSLHGCRRR